MAVRDVADLHWPITFPATCYLNCPPRPVNASPLYIYKTKHCAVTYYSPWMRYPRRSLTGSRYKTPLRHTPFPQTVCACSSNARWEIQTQQDASTRVDSKGQTLTQFQWHFLHGVHSGHGATHPLLKNAGKTSRVISSCELVIYLNWSESTY